MGNGQRTTDNGQPWTIRRLLEWTTPFLAKKGVSQPRLAVELLLSHVLGAPRIKLYTDYERVLDEAKLASFRTLVQRAAADEPIAYLTGKAHFFNLEFEVTQDVLIPRPDTETLVENVLQTVRHTPGLESPRVLDLCTGSGCIAASLATNLKSAMVVATDISEKAAAVARRNLEKLGLNERVTVAVGDLFEPISSLVDPRPFDLIVANPPYIATGQIATLDSSVKDYEPKLALDGGPDGLTIHRRILAGVANHLNAGGQVFLEIAFDQGSAARDLAAGLADFENVRTLKDHGGNERVLALRYRAANPSVVA